MLHTLLKFCYLFAVSTTAYRTPLRSTASSKTKIFESGFGEALSSVLPLLPTLLPIAGQVFVLTLLTQSSKKDITAVNVESKSYLKAVQGELKAVRVESKSYLKAVLGELKAVRVESKSDLKAVLAELKSERKAVQKASIHRAELNSGEMKVLLATFTRLASLVENADARNLRDL
jgi:hypothetical protein